MQEIRTKADTYYDFEEEDMQQAEVSFEQGGSRWRRTAGGYCFRDGRRVSRSEFDGARGAHLEELGRRLSAVAEEAREARGDSVIGRATARAQELAGDKEEKAVKKESKTRKRRPRDVAFECEVGGGVVTLTTRQCEFLQEASQCPCWTEGGTGIWTDVLLDEMGVNGMSFGAMVSTLREKHLLEVGRESREDGVTGRSRKVKVMRLTRLGEAVLRRAGYRLPGSGV